MADNLPEVFQALHERWEAIFARHVFDAHTAAHTWRYGDASLDQGPDPGDPATLGAQAEQRFALENDPTSDWYRQPGPDVQHDPELRIMGQERMYEQALVDVGADAGERQPLVIDTSDPSMGQPWHDTLSRLQERLDALTQDNEERTQERHRDQGRGV